MAFAGEGSLVGVTAVVKDVRATPMAWDKGRTTIPTSFASIGFPIRDKSFRF